MKSQCEAVAVRYVADVGTGEFLNIGVVLVCPEQYFARARFVSTWDRVTGAFPAADPVHLQAIADVIERTCEAWMGRARQLGKPESLEALLESAIHIDDAGIKFSPPISGVTADPARLLNELFARYAGHLAEVPPPQETALTLWMKRVVGLQSVVQTPNPIGAFGAGAAGGSKARAGATVGLSAVGIASGNIAITGVAGVGALAGIYALPPPDQDISIQQVRAGAEALYARRTAIPQLRSTYELLSPGALNRVPDDLPSFNVHAELRGTA